MERTWIERQPSTSKKIKRLWKKSRSRMSLRAWARMQAAAPEGYAMIANEWIAHKANDV